MSLTCRVQYLNDVDPFAYASSYPEPPRPPVHTFSATLPLINQLAAVHRLLRAPHRVLIFLDGPETPAASEAKMPTGVFSASEARNSCGPIFEPTMAVLRTRVVVFHCSLFRF
ncbi:hypothetical protein KM043_013549 [Ampulex compressa]|nr:hypothetical protein KM043_013549 [Ampulex compressa]